MHTHKSIGVLVLAAICGTAIPASAHFKLLTPASWLNEDASGGPQKGSPCGVGGSDDVSPAPTSGKVTEYHAGETIEVTWVDTIAHPGHFRIALAEDRADLKDPTIQQDSFCSYDETMVPKLASGNVLADGVSFRSRTGFSAAAGTKFSQKVTLPNKPCDKCTLQVMQIMENDLQAISNCYYLHCADVKILPAADGAAAGAGAAGMAGSGTAGASGAAAGAGAAGSGAGAGGIAGGAAGNMSAGRSGSAAGATAGAAAPTTSTTAGTGAVGATATTVAGGPATTAAGATSSAAAGTPATGTTTNAVTGMPAAAHSSGCSATGVRVQRGSQLGLVIVGAAVLFRSRRRRRAHGTR